MNEEQKRDIDLEEYNKTFNEYERAKDNWEIVQAEQARKEYGRAKSEVANGNKESKELITLHDEYIDIEKKHYTLECSDRVMSLNVQIGDLKEELDLIMKDIGKEKELKKQELKKAFKEKGIYEFGQLKARMKKNNKVNGIKVLNILEGDISRFLLLAEIKQSKLKEFYKDKKNSEIRQELKATIETVDHTISGFIVTK